MGRDLCWDGCVNVRDLGGLPVAGGGTTRWGAVVRADNPGFLTRVGWAALAGHGVRTIIGLRTVGFAFDEPDESVIPDGIGFERVFVEDGRRHRSRLHPLDAGRDRRRGPVAGRRPRRRRTRRRAGPPRGLTRAGAPARMPAPRAGPPPQ